MRHHARRAREKQELRSQILRAAREIALAEGWQAVTVRKIADHVEYSPAAIYEYFDGKEAILYALVVEGFRLVLAELQRAASTDPDPVRRLVTLAKAYWRFAWQHPELYQVMHGLGGVPFGTAGAPREAKEVFEFTRESVRAAREALGVGDLVPDEQVEIVWAMLHGLVSLAMSGRIPTASGADKEPLVEQAVRQLVDGWRA
jgi:AcrR family transcriptional regulator